MSRFLIEIPHDAEELSCARVVRYFLASGSHLLAHADWGCADGVHSAWIIVEVGTKEEARLTVPIPFRAQARIVGLNYFTLEQIDAIIDKHRP